MARRGIPTPHETRETVLRARATGATVVECARQAGVSNPTARKIIREAAAANDPRARELTRDEIGAAISASIRRNSTFAERSAQTRANRAKRIAIPAWVAAAGLTVEYRDIAKRHGEEVAASHCRRAKQARPALPTPALAAPSAVPPDTLHDGKHDTGAVPT